MHSPLPARIALGHFHAAFTLIELLVVITIIVVLLSLLTPALDKAIYQAELTVCAANLKATGGGGLNYAMNNRRNYPTRGAYRFEANQLVNEVVPTLTPEAFNLRDDLIDYVGVNAWVDPLCGEIEVDEANNDPDCVIFSNYHVYYGWGIAGFSTLSRYGKPFTFIDPGDPDQRTRRFHVLVADIDRGGDGWAHTSHADSLGRETLASAQNKDDFVPVSGTVGTRKVTFAWWQGPNRNAGTQTPSTIDNNYAIDDGSVFRLTEVVWDDPRTVFTVDTNLDQFPARRTQLPEGR